MSIPKLVNTLKKEILLDSWITVERHTACHEGFSKKIIGPYNREIVMCRDAVAVVLYDPACDSVVLIKQFRLPAHVKPIGSPWLWEVVAGMIEPGETPEDVAKREVMEESGLEILHMEHIHKIYTSPGITTETIQLFYAEVDSSKAAGIHGVETEHEDIEVHTLPWDQVELLMRPSNGMINAIGLVGLYWLQNKRRETR